MNRIRNLKRKKGFTLSELIVVLAIISLLIAAVAAFGDPVRSMVNDTTARSDTINISKLMGDYIERRLAYAYSVDIVINAKVGGTDDKIDNIFKKYKETLPEGSNYTKGMLVFKYEENSTDELKSTYKMYDKSIDSTSTYSIAASDAVYSNDFYSKYSYIITAEPDMVTVTNDDSSTSVVPKVKYNSLKSSPFLSFSIRSYDCRDNYIQDDTLSKYFTWLKGGSLKTNEATNGIYDLAMNRTALEEVSFFLENVTQSSDVNFSEPESAGAVGSDIIIFYAVQQY